MTRACARRCADTSTGLPVWNADEVLAGLARRLDILRAWSQFFERHPVLLMPNSWRRQFPVDADLGPPAQVHGLLAAQSPLLATAMLGLPGLAVPTGVADGLPVGVQIVTARFREGLALRAGEMIERAADYSVLRALGA